MSEERKKSSLMNNRSNESSSDALLVMAKRVVWFVIPILLMGMGYWVQLNGWEEGAISTRQVTSPQSHLYHIFVALFSGWIAWRVPTAHWRRYGRWGLWGMLMSLLLVAGFGREINGAIRAFELLGVSIAPATAVPLLLTITLAYSLPERKQNRFPPFSQSTSILLLSILLLVLLQPNGGIVLVSLLLLSVLLLLAGYAKYGAVAAGVLSLFCIASVKMRLFDCCFKLY